jgi:uncharacterized protein involved in exopolysaccharide biosynthesis
MTDHKQNPQKSQAGTEQVSQGHFVPAQARKAEEEINLQDLWQMLLDYKRMIAIVVLLSVAIFTIAALKMTPVYRADVLLVPSAGASGGGRFSSLASQFGGLADLAGITGGSSDGIETPIAILKSRKFITLFIDEFKLKTILFGNRWDEEKNEWIVSEPSLLSKIKKKILPDSNKRPSSYKPGEPTNEQAYNKFTGGILGISHNVKTKLVTLSIEWRDPEQAAEWANALVKRLNESLRQRTISEAERSIAYLEEQIKQTSIAELQNVLYRIIEEHTKNITLAKVNDEYAMKVIDPAVSPETSFKPKRKLIVIIGLVLGLMLGVFLAFLMNVIRSRKRVEIQEKI